jgi:hypothetical protein
MDMRLAKLRIVCLMLKVSSCLPVLDMYCQGKVTRLSSLMTVVVPPSSLAGAALSASDL